MSKILKLIKKLFDFFAKYFNQKSIFFFEIGKVYSFKCLRSICSAPLMFTFQCCQFIFWKLNRNIWCIFVIINFISVWRYLVLLFLIAQKKLQLWHLAHLECGLEHSKLTQSRPYFYSLSLWPQLKDVFTEVKK